MISWFSVIFISDLDLRNSSGPTFYRFMPTMSASVSNVGTVAKKMKEKQKRGKHPTYVNMIVEAISQMKEVGGSSRPAILAAVTKMHNLDPSTARLNVNRALKDGLKDDRLAIGRTSGKFKVGEASKVALKLAATKARAAARKAKAAVKPEKKSVKKLSAKRKSGAAVGKKSAVGGTNKRKSTGGSDRRKKVATVGGKGGKKSSVKKAPKKAVAGSKPAAIKKTAAGSSTSKKAAGIKAPKMSKPSSSKAVAAN